VLQYIVSCADNLVLATARAYCPNVRLCNLQQNVVLIKVYFQLFVATS